MRKQNVKNDCNVKQVVKEMTICANAQCKLRKQGCKGFEGCPGFSIKEIYDKIDKDFNIK